MALHFSRIFLLIPMVTYDHKEILRILPFEKSVYRISCAMVLSVCVVIVVSQSVVRNVTSNDG